MCARLKKSLEHAVQCDNAHCTRSCLITQKVIKHFKACRDPRCALCGPVKEIVSKRGAKIDNEESKRHDLAVSDEPEPKRVKTDQPNRMLGDVNTDLKKEDDTKIASDGEFAEELRAESLTDKELGCSVNEATKEPKVKSVKDVCSFVNNAPTTKPGIKSTMDEMLAKEVKMKTDKHVVVNESYNEDGIGTVEQVKDSDPLNNILKNGTEFELAKSVDSCAIETMEETIKQRVRGASLLDTFTLEEIKVHLSSLRLCEKKVSWVSS